MNPNTVYIDSMGNAATKHRIKESYVNGSVPPFLALTPSHEKF